MLYLDDLKLFAKSRNELECLVKTVQLFSNSIHMKFGIDKCATASVTRGKLTTCDGLIVSEDTVIPALNAHNSYKYLGVFELDQLKDKFMKEIIIATYRKRVRRLLKSALNGRNLILAINMWALPLIRYTAGILKWSQLELKQLDISTRKLLTLYKCFNVNDDVDRLYVSRQQGGHGLLSVEDTVHHEQLSLGQNIWPLVRNLCYKQCFSVLSGWTLWNLHLNLNLVDNKTTWMLGKQNLYMVNLLGRLMVAMMPHSSGDGYLIVI